MLQSQGARFSADPLTFIVRHQLWDGNVQDHADQGVSIDVAADLGGKETTLLRFNCFDIERSYIYGPENPELYGRADRARRRNGSASAEWTRSPTEIPSAGPSGPWANMLPKMIERAGYKQIAATPTRAVKRILPDVEACARETLRGQAEHGQTQPRHGHLRSRQHPVRARDAAAADGRRRPRHPRPRRHRWVDREELRRRNRAPGLRLLLAGRALPLWSAQQEPSDLLGQDPGRRPARVDVRAVREPENWRR